jgi:hypothetical protein
LPSDDHAAPVQAQRSTAAGISTLMGDESADRSSGAFPYPESHALSLPPADTGGGWALYSFTGLAAWEKPALVEVTLSGEPPARYWAGFSDYALEAWHWVEVVPAGTDLIDVRCLAQPLSTGGAFHAVILAYDAVPTEIAQLSLYFDLPPPPTHVVAEPGAHWDQYVLSWAKAETATGYEIFRDSKEEASATVGDVGTWTDAEGLTLDRTYWLIAVNEHGASGFSQPAYARAGAWQLQLIDYWGRYGTSLAVVDGLPVIAYVAVELTEDDDEIHFPRFARATCASPRGPDDWVKTTWNERSDAVNHTSPPWLAVLDGRPAFAIANRYYRALIQAPSSREDWEMHLFDAGANVPGAAPLIEYNGTPHVVYIDDHVDSLRFARGLSATPASESDWDISSIVGFDVMNPDDYYLAEIGGLPAVSYDRRAKIGESGNPCFAHALTAGPSSSSDWQRHIVDDIPGYPAGASEVELISLADGKPAISYKENYPGYTGLKFARATTLSPADTSDWVIHTVLADAEYVGIDTAMWLVDGRPAICYYDGEGLEYAAATVAAPTCAGDWETETLYEGEVREYMCLRVVNGQPHISFGTKHGLFLLTRRD